MTKPSETQLAALRAIVAHGPIHWTNTMFKGMSGAVICEYGRIPLTTCKTLVARGWIARSGREGPYTHQYQITDTGRAVIPPACVDCGSSDVKTFDPFRCGPCYIASASISRHCGQIIDA